MPSNIELKARANLFETQHAIAKGISDTPGETLNQHDTFFRVPSGRLKLREFGNGSAELISYQRPDIKTAKSSNYEIYKTNSPALLKPILISSLGLIGEVKKKRQLYFVGQTRIHMDDVERLGMFIEFEYVLNQDEDEKKGRAKLADLTKKMKIREEDFISVAYIDMLMENAA